MIVSMTGYGSITKHFELFDITVSVKAVNSKYSDIKMKLPKFLYLKEVELINIVKNELLRGKIDVMIDVFLRKPLKKAKLSTEYFNMYMDVLREIQIKSEILDDIKIEHILKFENIIDYVDESDVTDFVDKEVVAVLMEALNSVKDMRNAEGNNLQLAIVDSLNKLEQLNKSISTFREDVYKINFEKYKKRIEDLVTKVNEDRIVTEAGIISERLDISEEVERINSHLQQMKSVIENEFPCGKKLDFFCQELNREFNTIGSKSSQIEVINSVVNAKTEIDKIREQVQNII
ncbi:YicC family protein [Deferribacterales bacterium Es71-Z0220]|uniref:YicC/YloC family endoribonuclease n=1 Tax=Deferrivibrio essentukiensis TaxID=2880922 RepID=UPI001F621460|nr:YicC/YloC family endoribonuclease [Deferrivibrio essentukiensis]MCB4204681.1 YicC family protein [Deferrivibrio essentukiensis]